MKFKYCSQRDVTWSSSDDNYKTQTDMMNDDSVSECEIGLTKENWGPVFKPWFSQKLQQIFNTTASPNPNVSMHLSMAVTYSTTLQ
jgi:hypothetical protein